MEAKKAYNQVADTYDSSFLNNLALAEDDIIYSFLSAFFSNSLVLDLGSGTGAYLEHMETEDYVGVDIAKKMVKIAKEKFSRNVFVVADMAQLPFKDGSFDNVVSLFGGVSYASALVYKEIFRLLKPGGRFFLMVFNHRYHNRKSYILKKHNITVRHLITADIEKLLPEYARKIGFNFHGDLGSKLPRLLHRLWFLLEWAIFGRLHKLALFSLVYGEKPWGE